MKIEATNTPEGLTFFATDSCSSSMDLAWRLVEEKTLSDWDSVLVARQTAGRGQLGRPWHSPAGNVYGSIRIPRLSEPWRGLQPLLLADAVRSMLQSIGLTAEIKWPNDILVGRKKVGGILIEERLGVAIAGVGLNVVSAPSAEELRSPYAVPAGCLKEFGIDASVREIWIRLVRQARSRVSETVSSRHPRDFIDELAVHLAYMGEKIVLDAAGMTGYPATLAGLDIRGGIRVLTGQGERVFYSGSFYPAIR